MISAKNRDPSGCCIYFVPAIDAWLVPQYCERSPQPGGCRPPGIMFKGKSKKTKDKGKGKSVGPAPPSTPPPASAPLAKQNSSAGEPKVCHTVNDHRAQF